MSNELSYASVWDKLSAIDVSDHVKKKNNMSYLSWPWAWKVMMENYPTVEYFISDNEVLADGSVIVHLSLTITEGETKLRRDMFLPVMTGFKNTAKSNPDSRDVGDAIMRCLVKAMAMFGLGSYLYAGEDLPTESVRAREERQKSKPKSEKEEVLELKADDGAVAFVKEDAAVATEPEPVVSDEKKDVHRASKEVFLTFVTDATTIDNLKEFWNDNKPALKEMETEDEIAFKEVLDAFKAKKTDIMATAK